MAEAPRLLKETMSRCPVCHAAAPGRVFASAGKVFLQRTCEAHGEQTTCISSDERFYHVSLGSRCETTGAETGCCTPARGINATPNTLEKLSTCLALIEIVDSCNLACPTCFADSPTSKQVDCVSFEDFRQRIDGVVARKGEIEILQLSGGEPTLHPEFFKLLEWAQNHASIGYVLINTNGLRFAEDSFAREFDASFRRGKVQLYLQYDGPHEQGQRTLRGADLRQLRARVLEVTGAMADGGLPVTLAMTVTPDNLDSLWETIEVGLGYSHVRGVSFQPMFHSGRLPAGAGAPAPVRRLNTADILIGAVEQSAGRLRFEDFTPLPCGDPNCATIGYLLKLPGGVRSISDLIDFSQLQAFLEQRVNYNLDDLARCGCDSEPLGELLRRFELAPSATFRLFVKPFMDATTWDEDRIDRCCTHVIRPDGALDSFCRYYSGFPGTWNGPPEATPG